MKGLLFDSEMHEFDSEQYCITQISEFELLGDNS